jgi:hypothetical protein
MPCDAQVNLRSNVVPGPGEGAPVREAQLLVDRRTTLTVTPG